MYEPHRYFGKVEAATQLLLIELFNNLENTVAHTSRPDKVLDDLLVHMYSTVYQRREQKMFSRLVKGK